MKKRILSTLLVFCMVVTLLSGAAMAADGVPTFGSCGENVAWQFDTASGVLTISGTGPMMDYERGVNAATAAPWVSNPTLRVGVRSVIINDGVTSIGDYAFYSCWDMTGIRIPDSVTRIGIGSFSYSGIKTVDLPDGISTIEERTFEFSEITHLTIPNGVTTIGERAFDNSKLTDVTIPSSVSRIEAHAFRHCAALKTITLPEGVTTIGTDAFFNSGLANIYIPLSAIDIADAFGACALLTDIFYAGSENDWGVAGLGSVTVDGKLPTHTWTETTPRYATIHYNSTSPGMGGVGEDPKPDIPDGSEDISKITINGKSIQSLFSMPSTEYDNDLALFAAKLSEAAEDQTGDRILNYYRSLEWPSEDWEIYQYSGDYAYSIACTKLSKDENLLVITARGSQTLSEFIKDGFSMGRRDFFGYTTNDIVYDFECDIMDGLNRFLTDHEYLEEKDLKVLITGHSLGGAAANLNAARFTMFEDAGAWWSDITEQSDIYCYTFGAINSLSNNVTEKNGFENIHNVYNMLDSFGPNRCGNYLPSGLGLGSGKFGHMERYSHNYETSWYIPFVDSTNHLIENYIDSVSSGYVHCQKNSSYRVHGGGVWCPVDLKIYLEAADGPVLVGSITNNQIDEVEHPMVGLRVEGDKKYFYLPDNGNYTIELKGIGTGTMTYFAQDMDAETGEPIDDTGIVYQQVQLTTGKQFYSDIKVEGDSVSGILTEKVPLYILGESGKPEKEVLPDGKGTEVPITATDGSDAPEQPSKPTTPSKPSTPSRPTTPSNTTYPTTSETKPAEPQPPEPTPEPSQTPEQPPAWINPFTDVAANAWYYDAVKFASENALMTGITATQFAPAANLTRAQLAQILYNKEGKPAVASASAFPDVASGAWYTNAVIWAAEKNIVSGHTSGLFRPDDNITREQLAVMLWRYAGGPSTNTDLTFRDSDQVSDFAHTAIRWAVGNGILAGKGDNILDPKGFATRAQVAQMLANYLNH